MNDLLITADEWSCLVWPLAGVSIIIRARCGRAGVSARDCAPGILRSSRIAIRPELDMERVQLALRIRGRVTD